MLAPVERDNTGFVDHLVDNRYVARALQNLVPGAVTRRENSAWDAARDAALPGGEVHPVVLDMPQAVVSFLLGPRHDRHSPAGRIDNQRPPFTQLPFERIVEEARAGATPRSVRISRVQCRLVLFVEHFKGCVCVVRPDSLDVGLAIRRSRRSPLLRRFGAVRLGRLVLAGDAAACRYQDRSNRERYKTSNAHLSPRSRLIFVPTSFPRDRAHRSAHQFPTNPGTASVRWRAWLPGRWLYWTHPWRGTPGRCPRFPAAPNSCSSRAGAAHSVRRLRSSMSPPSRPGLSRQCGATRGD